MRLATGSGARLPDYFQEAQIALLDPRRERMFQAEGAGVSLIAKHNVSYLRRLTHQEFQAHPVVMHGTNSADSSHGTSTYGQIFASGVSAPQRGLLPDGQGIFATYDMSDRYAHTRELVDPAGTARCSRATAGAAG